MEKVQFWSTRLLSCSKLHGGSFYHPFELFFGASLSESHTSESNGGFFIYILSVIRRSVNASWLLTQNIAHAEFKCGRNIKNNTWSKYYRTLTFIVLGYKFCYPWIPRAVLEELSSQRKNKKSLKIGDGPGELFFWTRFENLVTKRRKINDREINDRVGPILVAIRNWNDVIACQDSRKSPSLPGVLFLAVWSWQDCVKSRDFPTQSERLKLEAFAVSKVPLSKPVDNLLTIALKRWVCCL